jgi:hypothetical protein
MSEFPVRSSEATTFSATLAKLRKEPKWEGITMGQVLERLGTGFETITGHIAPSLADYVARQARVYLEDMTPIMATDIGTCPVYHKLSNRTVASASISYADWFFLSCIYGPDETRLHPFRD